MNWLSKQSPDSDLLSEVQYWKSMDLILTAAWKETNEAFVESTLQMFQERYTAEVKSIWVFMDKIEQGQWESRVNKKFLLEIEGDLKAFLKDGSLERLRPILDQLEKMFHKSQFYKEARICSFYSHLYKSSVNLIKWRLDIQETEWNSFGIASIF